VRGLEKKKKGRLTEILTAQDSNTLQARDNCSKLGYHSTIEDGERLN
jgi:hypothetical protein